MTDTTTPLFMECEMHAARFLPETGVWTVLRYQGEDDLPISIILDGGRIVEIRPAPIRENLDQIVLTALSDEGRDSLSLVGVVKEGTQPKPFTIDYVNRKVDIGDEESVSLLDFQNFAFRCDVEGAYVANFLDPLWKQVKACEAAGAEAHVAEIHEGVETLRDSDNVYVQIDWRLFDIAVSGMTDGMTTEEVLTQARFSNDAPLHAVHGLDSLVESETVHIAAGYFDEYGEEVDAADADESGAEFREAHDEEEIVFDLSDWHEVREYPQYMIDGVRAMFRHFMADRIGDTPIEGITRIQKETGRVEDICRLLDQGGFEYNGKSRPFADAARVMGRPYETSDVISYNGNGLDIIVFEDFAGSYAYGWPEQPKPRLAAAAATLG